MRREHDERPAQVAIEVFTAFENDQPANAFLRTPPQDAVFEHRAPEGTKVPARKFLPLRVRHLREAQAQVRAHHAPAFPDQPVNQHAQAFAQRRHQPQGQQTKQPEQCHCESQLPFSLPWPVVSGGVTPAGTL